MGVSLLDGEARFLVLEDRRLEDLFFSDAYSGASGMGIALWGGMSLGGAGASSRIGLAPSSSSSGNRSSSLMKAVGVEDGEKPVQLGYAHVMLCERDEKEDALRDE